MNINKVFLGGHLGKDPEIKVFDNGGKVAKFSFATTEKWTAKDGTQKERTEWHNVVMNGKLADIAEKHFKKGQSLYIEGSIRYSEYEKDGQKKYITEIYANTFQFVGRKEGNIPASNEPDFEAPAPQTQDDGDLPF